MVLDITERKEREELHLMGQRLDAAGQLLRGLAHDFNNFLAMISATLEQVERRTGDAETVRRLGDARQAARAAALFSRRLINIATDRKWLPELIAVNEHVTEIARSLTSIMRPGIQLTTQVSPKVGKAWLDAVELESAIINLVINARDAITSSGRITIETSLQECGAGDSRDDGATAEHVLIRVTDTGRGMDDDTRHKATRPFFTTKAEGAGTGLGLSSVSAFVSRAGGVMTIASKPGQGTSVSLFLPNPRQEEHGPSLGPAADIHHGNGELILVVDDEAAIREITMQRLEALGYTVEGAADALDAINLLRTVQRVDLVLSDIHMPGEINGLGLRDRIAAELPGLPVILITADDGITTAMQAREAGERILPKTCSRRDLAHALSGALKARAQTSQPPQDAA